MGAYSRINSPSKAASKSNSRSQSRGPGENDENELLNGISFGNIDEMISLRLAMFMKNYEDSIKTPQKYPMHSVKGLSDLLINTRSPIPATDREALLNQLYSLNVKTGEGRFEDMVDIFRISKGYELLVAVRNVAASAIANCDDVADEAIEFLGTLESKIASSELDNSTKEQFVFAYSAISLVVYEGSGAYGVDKKINFLLETLLGLVTDLEENAAVIGSLIYGIGCLLTLLENNAGLNCLLENICESTVELLLDTDLLEITKPMSMLFALAYEMYHYVDDALDENYDAEDEQQPYIYTYEVKNRLQELVSTSQVKQSKKNKTEGRSIFREAVQTVRTYSDRAERIQMQERLREGLKSKSQADHKDDILTHIRLSKTKSIAIRSWVSFFRVVELKWVYGPGLYNQLAHNPTLVAMIEHNVASKFKATPIEATYDTSDPAFVQTTARESHIKKEKMIKHGRAEKLANQLEQTGLNDEE